MIKTLTFSTLYPNAAQPIHGIFVERRLHHLLATGHIATHVVAPVPWFPSQNKAFGSYATFAKVPRQEKRNGIEVYHPRFPRIPKVGMTIAPVLLALSALPLARILCDRDGGVDLIDAHYFYPDGVAAVLLGRWLKKPVVITGRGTDLNLIPQHALARRQIQWAAKQAAALVTVCGALKEVLINLGTDPSKVTVLRNGVDANAFFPKDRDAARKKFGVTRPALASVGGLIERKGHHLAIAALPSLSEFQLYIAGDGPDRSKLQTLAQELGVSERVQFLGSLDQGNLRELYEAVDALVLASSREGWANVLLESMACGTPVVASNIWGTPEVVSRREAGVIFDELSPQGVEHGVRRLFGDLPRRNETVEFARRFTWDPTSKGQLEIFRRVIARDT